MSDNENKKGNNANNAAPLSENELGDVNGGLWGITIMDTCPHEFSFDKCCYNFGKCPNLVVKKSGISFNEYFQKEMYDYVFSCAKGYFYNERAMTSEKLPSY